MNFLQLQLFEYSIATIAEIYDLKQKQQLNYSITFKSSDDVFSASTLLFNKNDDLSFEIINSRFSNLTETKTISFSDIKPNPFMQVRTFIFDKFFKGDYNKSYIHFVKTPYLFLDIIRDFILSIDIQHDFDMPKIFHNYESLLYKNLNLTYKFIDTDEFDVLNYLFTSSEMQEI